MTNDNKTPKGDVLDLPMGLTRAKIDANNDEPVVAISVATNSKLNNQPTVADNAGINGKLSS